MIPNILTTVRLLLVPLFGYAVLQLDNLLLAAGVLLLSGLTDVADGYIARHYNMITQFGKVYDPFVDKLMQLTIVICLYMVDIIPGWILGILFLKEFAMIIIGGVLYIKKIVVQSKWYGKASTSIFYGAMFLLVLWKDMPDASIWTLLFLVVVSMVASAIAYLIDTIKHYEEKRV